MWVRGSQTFEAICEAINIASLDSHAPLVAPDPGRRSLFSTAIYSPEASISLKCHATPNPKFTTQSWSEGRWYEESGITHRILKSKQWLQPSPTLQQALQETPTAKVSCRQQYGVHIQHRLQHLNSTCEHFAHPRERKLRRSRKMKQQRAMARVCNDIRHNRFVTAKMCHLHCV